MCQHCGKGISGKYLLVEQEAKRMAARGVVRRAPATPLTITPIGLGARVLLVFAALAVPAGVLTASNATAGIAVLSVGAILGIMARINQAARHHQELMTAVMLNQKQS